MGQGAESCGGYELEYDPYEEEMPGGYWTEKSGGQIHVSKMSEKHLKNTIRMCKGLSRSANFSCESEKWDNWVDILEDELSTRKPSIKKAQINKPKKPVRGVKVKMQCHCGKVYEARKADLNRGWGLSCSKRCSAIRREFGRPAGKEMNK